MRTYAKNTSVSIAKSRAEIDKLLREWGAAGTQWTDDFERGKVTLRFLWTWDGLQLRARFTVNLKTTKELHAEARTPSRGTFSEAALRKLLAQHGQQEHRVLLLWLKAAFNAVDAGITRPEVIFLPYLEGTDERTVAEALTPRLAQLPQGSVSRFLLGSGS